VAIPIANAVTDISPPPNRPAPSAPPASPAGPAQRQPWPMKWIVLAILIFILAYNLNLWLGS
jgi:hypothetical protein